MMDVCEVARVRKYILVGVVASLFIMIAPIQQSINYSRVTEDLVEQIVIMPGEFVTNFVICGFRGVASDIMWVKIDMLWHHGRWFEILPLLRSITWMQPHFIEAWDLASWHLAYNLYAYTEDASAREIYAEEGIKLLKEGIAKNRNVYDLWFSLGWIYYNKLEDYGEGVRYFKSATRFEHPSYIDRMIAHAYRKNGDIESEYRQWQYCGTIFQDEDYHLSITDRHLRKAEEVLREQGKI